MDIKQLARFLDLYETRNFTKTAQRMFLSQQALSSTINSLEEELGKILFVRTSKGLLVTEEGEILKQLCWPVIENFEHMTKALNERFAFEKQKLVFGLAPAVLSASAPNLLLKFKSEHPTIELRAVEDTDVACVNNVLNGIVEFSFCPKPFDENSITYIPYDKEKIVAIVNKKNPLSNKKLVTFNDLKKEKLVSFNRNNQIYHSIISSCVDVGFTPSFVAESGESHILLAMVKLDDCVFICMDYVADDLDQDCCVKIPIEHKNNFWEYGIIAKKNKNMTFQMKKFLEFLSKNNPC